MAAGGSPPSHEGPQAFGALLQRHRLAAGLSQEELAERAGLSRRGISDLERGRRQAPYLATIRRLAEALGLPETERALLLAASRRRGPMQAGEPLAAPSPAGELPRQLTTFVGREAELALLNRLLADARAGQGGLVVLTGEPGIGKTRLAECFAARAQASSARVLWGRCAEGDISPPYGPWAELLSTAALLIHPDRLRDRLGAGAAALARLVPQVGAALPELPAAARLAPDDERFRLQDAVTQLVLSLAEDTPLVLVLDDLHWADGDSLRLLHQVARFVRRARLLLVGTYRDLEVDRGHPLAETLAMLRREVDYTRVSLKGWTVEETAAYLGELASHALPEGVVRRIQEEAEGNPFYTSQIFRHLVEARTLVQRDGRWSTDHSLQELGIPEGVRQVIGRRLARLSEETTSLLRRAAALSGGWTFALLLGLSSLDEPTLLDCLDEALAAGLIRAVPGQDETYEFAHALVRHTLYDELSPSRRLRLHRHLAELLEATAGDRAAAEIAAQYHASAGLPGAERGLPYALRAAEQAQARYAPEQVVALLRLARGLTERSAPAQRAEVLQRLAVAEAEAVQLSEAPRTVEAALVALDESGAGTDLVVSFLEAVARALKEGGAAHTTWEPLVERGLALLGERRDLLWARLTLLQDRYVAVSSGAITVVRWLGHDQEAVTLARRLGDEDDYARSLDLWSWRAPAETEDILAHVRHWSRPEAVLRGLDVVTRDLLHWHGALPATAERCRDYLAAGRRYGSLPAQVLARAQLGALLAQLGQFAEARRRYADAQELVGRLGPDHRLHFVVTVAAPMLQLAYPTAGDWATLTEGAQRNLAGSVALRSPYGFLVVACAALGHLRTGDAREARHFLQALARLVEQLDPWVHLQNTLVGVAGVVAWELEARELAPLLLRLARELVQAGVGPGFLGSHELAAARMAALLEEWADAERWFAQARVVEESCGHRPARALVDFDEAVVLLRRRRADRRRAQALLAAATEQFRILGMDSWLDRAETLARSRPARR